MKGAGGSRHGARHRPQSGSGGWQGARSPSAGPGGEPGRRPPHSGVQLAGVLAPPGLKCKGRVVRGLRPGSRGPPASRDREHVCDRGPGSRPHRRPGGGPSPASLQGPLGRSVSPPGSVRGPSVFRFVAMLAGFGDRGTRRPRGSGIQTFILGLTPAPAAQAGRELKAKVACVKGQVGDRTQPLGAGLGLMSQTGGGEPLRVSCAPAAIWEDRDARRSQVASCGWERGPGWLPRPAPRLQHRRRGRQWGTQTSPRPGSQLRPVKGDSEAGTDSWATGSPQPAYWDTQRELDAFCGPSPGSPGDPAAFLAGSRCSGDLHRVPASPRLWCRSQQARGAPRRETRSEQVFPRSQPVVFTRPPDYFDIYLPGVTDFFL